MESTVVQVLILNGLGEVAFYEVVTWVGLKILRGFYGSRGGGVP